MSHTLWYVPSLYSMQRVPSGTSQRRWGKPRNPAAEKIPLWRIMFAKAAPSAKREVPR